MDGLRFRSFVKMLIRPGDCLVKKGRAIRPVPSLSFEGLNALNGQGTVRHETLKASKHSLTMHADTELSIRSLRVSVRIVLMIVGPSKVGRMSKIRFMLK